jgi:hypothetical protein
MGLIRPLRGNKVSPLLVRTSHPKFESGCGLIQSLQDYKLIGERSEKDPDSQPVKNMSGALQ